ncbi:MAG: PEP-CTERM sorting domain-containing protein [Planctomycetota bacterium]
MRARRFAMGLCAGLVFACTVPAVGVGTATFTAVGDLNPATPNIAEVLPNTIAVFSIRISTTNPDGFETADLIIGANGLPGPVDPNFVYDPAWLAAFASVVSPPIYATGVFGYERLVYVGGGNPTSVGTSLALGTLSLATTGLVVGDTRTVKIDSVQDGFSGLSRLGILEGISGIGTISIVPEPASLALLVLGAGCGLRRRRR